MEYQADPVIVILPCGKIFYRLLGQWEINSLFRLSLYDL